MRTSTIEAIVTAPATLLDTTGRRIVVQDAIGGDRAPAADRGHGAARRRPDPGDRPDRGRLRRASTPRGPRPDARRWTRARTTRRCTHRPTSPTNGAWSRSAVGSTTSTKLGDRWRAELTRRRAEGPDRRPAGSRDRERALVEGRIATVVGIARRPFPTATDRRFAILPRSADRPAARGRPAVARRPAGRDAVEAEPA